MPLFANMVRIINNNNKKINEYEHEGCWRIIWVQEQQMMWTFPHLILCNFNDKKF